MMTPFATTAENPRNAGISFAVDSPYERGKERRILAALGLAGGPLPEVERRWLARYYRFLNGRLLLPFDAVYAEDIAGYQQIVSKVAVLELLDPRDASYCEERGILCRAQRGDAIIELPLADVELADSHPNYQLIEDYWYWFWNMAAPAATSDCAKRLLISA